MTTIRPIAGDDIMLWPDGTWCFCEDAAEYAHMSDDYEVVVAGSPHWDLLEHSNSGAGR